MTRRGRHGRTAGAAVALIVFLRLGGAAMAQISPGELARAHQELEGPRNCLTCHGGKSGAMDGACLDCHGDIAELMGRDRGLHALEGDRPCASCHPDHAGRDFQLIDWEGGTPDSFDHSRTGWALTAKHAALKCRTCHRPELQNPDVMAKSRRRNPSDAWIGLETDCASCHRDPHRSALGSDCARCHGISGFKPASAFDHAASAYPLTGKHAGVECAKCHAATGLDLPRDEDGVAQPLYKPLAHAECSTCHRDPHEGRLGDACAKCHHTDGFSLAASGEAFDHARTRYPLEGRHRDVKCRDCHDPVSAWGRRPASDRCNACHADAHAGTALLAGQPADCAGCHDVNGFVPSTYTVAQHRAAAYPLEGRHAETACRACHLRRPPGISSEVLGSSGTLLRPPREACSGCHADPHAAQLAGRPGAEDCAGCHTVQGFKPSRFGVAEHASLRLPLQGRHAEAPCSSCHGANRPGLPPLPGPEVTGRARVWLALDTVACVDCHLDPHQGGLAGWRNRVQASAPADSASCSACHGTAGFMPSTVAVTAHRGFSFPLEGAHQAVPCVACHRELDHAPLTSTLITAAATAPRIPFDQNRTACRACHEDPHGGQFDGSAGPAPCARCHGQESFRPADRFDHTRDTEFSLSGAHARVACSACHEAKPFADGQDRARYRPTPKTCESCHRTFDVRAGLSSGPGTAGGGS